MQLLSTERVNRAHNNSRKRKKTAISHWLTSCWFDWLKGRRLDMVRLLSSATILCLKTTEIIGRRRRRRRHRSFPSECGEPQQSNLGAELVVSVSIIFLIDGWNIHANIQPSLSVCLSICPSAIKIAIFVNWLLGNPIDRPISNHFVYAIISTNKSEMISLLINLPAFLLAIWV